MRAEAVRIKKLRHSLPSLKGRVSAMGKAPTGGEVKAETCMGGSRREHVERRASKSEHRREVAKPRFPGQYAISVRQKRGVAGV